MFSEYWRAGLTQQGSCIRNRTAQRYLEQPIRSWDIPSSKKLSGKKKFRSLRQASLHRKCSYVPALSCVTGKVRTKTHVPGFRRCGQLSAA